MSGGWRKWMRANIGTFLQQYQRKAQRGVEPNDRHYDRDFVEKLKRMKPEELSRLMNEEDDAADRPGRATHNAESTLRLTRVMAPTPAYWLVLQARYDLAMLVGEREG